MLLLSGVWRSEAATWRGRDKEQREGIAHGSLGWWWWFKSQLGSSILFWPLEGLLGNPHLVVFLFGDGV